MALVTFEGISFTSPGGYLCYCNSTINAILASNVIASNLNPAHCGCCNILYAKKVDPSINQSSIELKNWIAQKYTEFQSREQQDPSKFKNFLLIECAILAQLTTSEILSIYYCV